MNHHKTPTAARLNHMAGQVRVMHAPRQAPGQMEVLADFVRSVADAAGRFDLVHAVRLERLAEEIRGRARPFAPYSQTELQYLAARMAAAASDLAVTEAAVVRASVPSDGGNAA